MKYCPNCKENKDLINGVFCNVCGTKLEDVDSASEDILPNTEDIRSQNRKGRKSVIILTIAVLILLCVLGVIGYNLINAFFPTAFRKNMNEPTTTASIEAFVETTESDSQNSTDLTDVEHSVAPTDMAESEDQTTVVTPTLEESNKNNGAALSYEIGSYVKFGSYDQDNNLSNGFEEIEWMVIDKHDNSALLISRYALDCLSYNNTHEETSWEECSLRQWLNGTFYNKAFSPDEQDKIANPYLSDKVFVLSIAETNQYFSTSSSRKTGATKTAVANGSYQENDVCGWWLRDTGDTSLIAARVNKDGDIVTYDSTEGGVERKDYSVRPAIWITII